MSFRDNHCRVYNRQIIDKDPVINYISNGLKCIKYRKGHFCTHGAEIEEMLKQSQNTSTVSFSLVTHFERSICRIITNL